MDMLQLPRIDARTPEGKIEQLTDFIFKLVQNYNNTVSDLERQIHELKEE